MKSYTINKFNYLSDPKEKKIKLSFGIVIAAIGLLVVIGIINANNGNRPNESVKDFTNNSTIEQIPENTEKTSTPQGATSPSPLYQVISVTDGDTIRIDYDGASTPLRLIGVDTPESVDPRTTVQCFGVKSYEHLKSRLTGKQVRIESDPTQSDRDKYDRLLRYVYLDNEDIGLSIITNGYGHEYTYSIPYQKQAEYKNAQSEASKAERGLWSPSTCAGSKTTAQDSTSQADNNLQTPATPTPQDSANCVIKGNINNKGEKIYHMPGQKYYNQTKINTSQGERYFCTEQEAINAGWRKSKV